MKEKTYFPCYPPFNVLGPDNVSPCFLKNRYLKPCHPHFHFSVMCQLKVCIFPASWNIVQITPVYKNQGLVTDSSASSCTYNIGIII